MAMFNGFSMVFFLCLLKGISGFVPYICIHKFFPGCLIQGGAPPSYKLVYNPTNYIYIYISTISPIYWSYKPT